MEINKFSDILGVITGEAIVEGRFVLLTTNNVGSYDFGSRQDLPAVIRPKTLAQSYRAKYIITWIVPNQSLPYYIPESSYSMPWSLRHGGFDQAGNLPFNPTAVHLTWPGQKNGVTIPSGYLALAFAAGVYTIPSGAFVYNVGLRTPGTYVVAADDGTDGAGLGGMPKISTTPFVPNATTDIGVVERFDVANWALQLRTFQP
jgi:hypothetical protein